MKLKDIVLEAKKQAWFEIKEEEVVAKEEEVVEEQKANEVMNTGASNFWTELIPTNVLADPLLDMLWNYSRLLPMLPWNHWNNMAVSEKVPVIWEASLFQWNSEWTTGAWTLTPANNWPMTDSVVITQWQFITTVDVSDRELTYATDRLEAIIRERITIDLSHWADDSRKSRVRCRWRIKIMKRFTSTISSAAVPAHMTSPPCEPAAGPISTT